VSSAWPQCQIVYVTNHLRYAPDVYATEHLWFVTKERFEEHLPEVMDKLQRKMDEGSRVLFLRTISRQELRVSSLDIVCLERHGRETTITLANGETYTVRDRLPELMNELSPRMFCNSHASFVVNLEHVRMLRTNEVELDNGTVVPMSRRHRRAVREAFLEWVDDHAV
jgi:DNA-binding LytR/AlgR family response regulator